MVAIGADPIVSLTPSLAAELGRGDAVVRLLASSFGVGAVGLTVTLRFLREIVSLRIVGVVRFWCMSAGLAITAMSTTVGVAMLRLCVAGYGFMMANISLNTHIQRRVPDELRGRVMALWVLAFLGSRPIGAAMNGALADGFSIRVALLILAVILVVSSLLSRVRYGHEGGSEPASS